MTELEWETRKERIDKKLRAITPCWDITPYRDGLDVAALEHDAVTEFPTANGPADYALIRLRAKLLGIIEAKKVSVGPQNVLEQAKRYSRGAFNGPGNWNGYRVPFPLFHQRGSDSFPGRQERKRMSPGRFPGSTRAMLSTSSFGRVSGHEWFHSQPQCHREAALLPERMPSPLSRRR